jgi:UDP-N-acetylglucosamine 2-epimerase (non-hydrolysing)
MGLVGLKADHDLALMAPKQTLTHITCGALQGLKEEFTAHRPDLVLVQGDTTTAFASALAAFYEQIPVGHVEAGLRTFDKWAPFPEEMNRALTGRLADYHFAPTEGASQNLILENISPDRIEVTGNTVIDALHMGLAKIQAGATSLDLELVKQLIIPGKRMIVITGHRRENFGDGFEQLCKAIKAIAQQYEDVQMIYPVHLNPNVQEPVNRILGELSNVHLIAPIDYPTFIYLMQQSYLILTDSGGVQEEAPSLGKPVLVMRDTTERPEAVEAGTVILTGTDCDTIVTEIEKLLNNSGAYENMSKASNPYGDGKAAQRIMAYFTSKYL